MIYRIFQFFSRVFKKNGTLYSVSYRTLTKEMEGDAKEWKNILCSRIGGTNVYATKASYIFNAILIKIPLAFFPELEQTILKFVFGTKDPK